MSLKSVELQIALPKTFEAGKLTEEAQQHVYTSQDLANQSLQKQIERNRTKALESNQSAQISENDSSSESKNNKQQEQKKKHQSVALAEIQHPFKGHFVDFSG
ncbi:RNA polymerase subunit sigma [Rummeliibacillus pycnus]|uniref:RNA polymerase subunit sigma n=1 Tax=Rummeliibacillus pycnus TaxID=101070 RepID=UPI000C9AD2F1|nr:RNA polymerase subunit sigma [Rummeliibacillus pycnus]